MKGRIWLFAVLLMLFMPGNALALALGNEITIWDDIAGGSGWYDRGTDPGEDQEVEPNCITGQVWDLEGFFLDGTKLIMVGGYDFEDGYGSGGSGPNGEWISGDIFIDTSFDALYGSTAPSYGGSQGANPDSVQDTFNYEYALRLNFTNNTYDVYELNATTTILKVYFNVNQGSNPFQYESGGELKGSGSFTFYEGLADADVGGLQGSSHYAVQLELLALLGTDFISHFTYECGNDNLMGDTRTIPDASALVLLGSAMVAVSVFSRKKVFKRS